MHTRDGMVSLEQKFAYDAMGRNLGLCCDIVHMSLGLNVVRQSNRGYSGNRYRSSMCSGPPIKSCVETIATRASSSFEGLTCFLR